MNLFIVNIDFEDFTKAMKSLCRIFFLFNKSAMYRWVPCKEINWRRRNSEVGKTSIYWETKSLWRCFSWRNATLYHTWINRKYSTYFFSFDKKYSFFLCLYKGISFSEPIVGSRSSQSLDDITLDEDTDSEKQLQDFLEAEETVCINIYIQYTNVCIFAIQISTSKTPITLGFSSACFS